MINCWICSCTKEMHNIHFEYQCTATILAISIDFKIKQIKQNPFVNTFFRIMTCYARLTWLDKILQIHVYAKPFILNHFSFPFQIYNVHAQINITSILYTKNTLYSFICDCEHKLHNSSFNSNVHVYMHMYMGREYNLVNYNT